MDIGNILSRSLELMWKFKFLWLFGFVMGLTGGGSSGGGNFNFQGGNFPFTPPTTTTAPRIEPAVVILVALVGLVIAILGLVLFFYFRFVARGALVAGVQEIEEDGSSTLRDAWSKGRKFYARLLGLGFVVNVPLALFFILVIVVAFVPAILVLIAAAQQGRDAAPALFGGALAGIVLGVCFGVACLVLVNLIVHPLYEFAVRAIVVEDMRTMEGISHGIRQARENLGNVLLVYLVLIVARIGWFIAIAIVSIPFGIAGLFGLMGLANNLNLLFILILLAAIPLWLLFGALEGLFQTFEANVWTETYLAILKKQQPASGNQPLPPDALPSLMTPSV